jgi:hypothetical protein
VLDSEILGATESSGEYVVSEIEPRTAMVKAIELEGAT